METPLLWRLQENIITYEDKKALIDYILKEDRFTQFTQVKKFEEEYSKWQGCKYSVFVNSGSSANLILINALKEKYGWNDGDEVIVPPVTWVTNISPVMQCGLKPVFVDINLHDLSFDYDRIAEKITPRTRAIFVTHLIGIPADMDRINAIARAHNLVVMEDCCESHGAVMANGRKVGTAGVTGTFSFYWGHHITTVEGGMLCTDDIELRNLYLLKRSHGLARELPSELHQTYRDKHPEINFEFLFLTDGFNFRNTELHATLGQSQIKERPLIERELHEEPRKIDEFIKRRNRTYQRFLTLCKQYPSELRVLENAGISSFCLPFIFKDAALRKEFQAFLKEKGVQTRPLISGNLLRQPFLQAYNGSSKDFPNANYVHDHAFYIGNNQFVDDVRMTLLEYFMREFFSKKNSSSDKTQFVCEGECGGVSDNPGTCQATTCSHYSMPLIARSS